MFFKKNENIQEVSISTGTIFRFFLVGLSFFLFWYLQNLFWIILISIVFASFVEAFIPFFTKMKIGRTFGVIIFYIFFIFILVFLFYLFAPVLVVEIYNLGTFLIALAPDYLENFSFLQDESFLKVKDTFTTDFSIDDILNASLDFLQNLSGGFIAVISNIFGGLFNLVLILIISFYLSIQEKGIEKFLRIIFPIKYEDYVISLWYRTSKKIALWIKGQLLLGVFIAIISYLTLIILSVQYALLLALIAGVMVLIPYGLFVALIPAASLAYISGGVPSAFIVALCYVILSQLESFVLTPLIVNKVVGLSPLTVILAVLFGFALGGVWGVILAIPGAVLFVEFLDDLQKNKFLLKNKNE